jgi:hypothetical protein
VEEQHRISDEGVAAKEPPREVEPP